MRVLCVLVVIAALALCADAADTQKLSKHRKHSMQVSTLKAENEALRKLLKKKTFLGWLQGLKDKYNSAKILDKKILEEYNGCDPRNGCCEDVVSISFKNVHAKNITVSLADRLSEKVPLIGGSMEYGLKIHLNRPGKLGWMNDPCEYPDDCEANSVVDSDCTSECDVPFNNHHFALFDKSMFGLRSITKTKHLEVEFSLYEKDPLMNDNFGSFTADAAKLKQWCEAGKGQARLTFLSKKTVTKVMTKMMAMVGSRLFAYAANVGNALVANKAFPCDAANKLIVDAAPGELSMNRTDSGIDIHFDIDCCSFSDVSRK